MLSKEQRKAVIQEAVRAGVPEAEAIAAAEKIVGGGDDHDQEITQAALSAERFLVGFLPYVTVREFRTKVLGLSEPAADDHLFTGEWLEIHGPQTATPAATGEQGDDGPNGRNEETPSQMGEEA